MLSPLTPSFWMIPERPMPLLPASRIAHRTSRIGTFAPRRCFGGGPPPGVSADFNNLKAR